MRHLLTIGIGVAVFIALEFLLKQERLKHFWASVLTIISLVLSFAVDYQFNLDRKIDDIHRLVGTMGDEELEKDFQRLWQAYYKYFQKGSATEDQLTPLKKWARLNLKRQADLTEAGTIRMQKEEARQHLGKFYDLAQKYVLATNVGDLDFFFGNRYYVERNQNAVKRGVPVIRFFIYSGTKHPNFRDEAKKKHKNLLTTCSIFLNWDEPQVAKELKKARDILFVDNAFVAEADLNPQQLDFDIIEGSE